MSWATAFALLSRYYPALGPKAIGQLSLYQFYRYLYEIPNIEKIFSGNSKKNNKAKTSPLNDKELIERARSKGFMTPSKY